MPEDEFRAVLPNVRSWLEGPFGYSRKDLVARWGREFAVDMLPRDFAGARSEGIARGIGFLAVGEYGMPGKRLAFITRDSCEISDYYVRDPKVLHIHALNYAPGSQQLLVATGDAAKVLDSWHVSSSRAVPLTRLRPRLAGHTAILRTDQAVYLGTDFTGRPNYIETLGGSRYYYPRKAYRSYVISFSLIGRLLLSYSAEEAALGGRATVSAFDISRGRFVLCEDVDGLRAG